MNKIVPWMVTAGAVLVLLVAVGGYMLSGTQTSAPVSMTRVASSTTNDSNSQPTPTSTDKFADWKTYQSDKYNFSFRYPSSWQLLLGADAYDGPSGNIFSDSAADVVPIFPTSTYSEGLRGVSFEIQPFDITAPYKSIEQEGGIGVANAKEECTETTVTQRFAYHCIPTVTEGGSLQVYIIPTTRGQSLYILDAEVNDESNAILNSLLIGSSTQLSGTQTSMSAIATKSLTSSTTYSNIEFGFEFNYPSEYKNLPLKGGSRKEEIDHRTIKDEYGNDKYTM